MGCCISERNKERLISNEQDKNEDQDKSYNLDTAEKDEAIKKISFLDSFRTKALRIDDTQYTKPNKILTIKTNLTQASSQSQSVKYKWKIEKDLNTSKIQDRIKILIKLNNLEFVFDNFLYVYHSAFNPLVKISDGRVTREFKNLTDTKIDKKQNTKDKSFQGAKQTINTSGLASDTKSNKENSMSQTEAEVLDLINTSVGIDANLGEMSTDNEAGVILNFEDSIHSKEFVINTKYSKEIHNWLHINLSNEIVYFINSIEMPLAVGYLPLNLILFKHNHLRQPFNVKIPLINPIDDVVIAYLNVTIENNCEYEMLRPLTEDIARSKLANFYSSKNILNINDMDPFLVEKYFTSLNSHNKQHANEEVNKNIYESLFKFLENLKLEEIQKLIIEEQQKKLPYDWEIYNPCNYYTFLTIISEVFGKSVNIRDLKDSSSNPIINQINKAGVKFFNIMHFQPDFETNHSDCNCPIVNNLLTVFVTFHKEKIHEKDYCEKELSDMFSIQNFFKAFGESYYKVLEKLSKYDISYDNIDFNQEKETTSNKQILNKISSNLNANSHLNFDSTDHLNYLLYKSIQNNFLKLTNMILETYLKKGMHPKKSLIFTSKKVFFQNELHCFKHKMKEYFLLNGTLLKDSNFVFGVLKILISFIKFGKIFCYLNSFNHSFAYIDTLLIKDNTLTQWILSVFNDYITNPRLFPMFLELVFEISQELKGIQFFHFKKYFELPLFTMNFTPYLKSTIKNELVLHFIVRIFLKFSSFTYNDSRQFIDFISLNCTEIALLYINCFNILLVITKEEKFSVFSQKFKKVLQIETVRLYSSKKIAAYFYFSVFHLQIFTNLLSILSNLFINHFQFKINFQSQNRIKMLKLVMRYISAFVFFDADYFLKENDEKDLRNVEEINKIIYYEMFEKSLNYIRNFVLAVQMDDDSKLNIKSILKEVVEEICFNIHFDQNELWSDFMFNLSKKIEKYCQADKLLKFKGKKKMMIDEIHRIVDQNEDEDESISQDII